MGESREQMFIGKTLEQILIEERQSQQLPLLFRALRVNAVSVFVLQDENDTIGRRVAEEFSLGVILKEHVDLRQAVVVRYNDFFGEDVFRVRIGA